MAGRRVHGGSNMTVILENEGFSPEVIEALLASGSPTGFHGSRSMVNFEDVRGSTQGMSSFYRKFDPEEMGDDDLDQCFHHPGKKRRLMANQVQFLERSFELENKLEPERKIQLARDLGLQPRQVAIWFQNRRARWKTKQLEKDYEALKSSYNRLKVDYENLREEEKKLEGEVLVLVDKLHIKEKEGSSSQTLESKNPLLHHHLQKPELDSTSEIKKLDVPILVCKQEDVSSANSAAFDSESTCYAGKRQPSPQLERANSSNAFEQDHSDLSHAEEDEEDKTYHFPKLEDEDSCNYGIPVEDQTFRFWP